MLQSTDSERLNNKDDSSGALRRDNRIGFMCGLGTGGNRNRKGSGRVMTGSAFRGNVKT